MSISAPFIRCGYIGLVAGQVLDFSELDFGTVPCFDKLSECRTQMRTN